MPGFPAPPPRPDLSDASTGIRYASFWQRLGGRIIDGLILGVPAAIGFWGAFGSDIMGEIRARQTAGQFGRWDIAQLGGRFLAFTLFSALVAATYEIVLIHLKGQTVGKMAVHIKVIQIEDGGLPSWDRSLIRWAVPEAARWVPVIGGLLALVVYLWMLWDPSRQGLHDKAARTIVIRTV